MSAQYLEFPISRFALPSFAILQFFNAIPFL
jgi:hypothetical protein